MKKAKLSYTKNGYSYIKVTPKDCFEWGGLAICDDCNETISDEGYLIYILNSAYCRKCFEEWCKRSKKYQEDLELQKQNHLKYYRAYGFKVKEE